MSMTFTAAELAVAVVAALVTREVIGWLVARMTTRR